MASGSFTSVNLSQLPAPAVIEVLDFEAMFDESLTALQALDPTFDALLPSDRLQDPGGLHLPAPA